MGYAHGRAAAIVVAAGSGERLGAEVPKAFVEVAGRPMLALAAGAAAACPSVGTLIVVAPPGLEAEARSLVGEVGVPLRVVAGGVTRQASVRSGLDAVGGHPGGIVVHDAARPFATPELFGRVLAALGVARGVVPVLPVPDTVKRVREGIVLGTEVREELWLAQTPQAFDAEALRSAHARAAAAGLDLTDDAAVLERAGYRVRAVRGETGNFKITTSEDLARAELLLGEGARG